MPTKSSNPKSTPRRSNRVVTQRNNGNGHVKTGQGGYEFLWTLGLSNIGDDTLHVVNPASKLWLVNTCVNLKARKIASVPFVHCDDDGNVFESGDLIDLWRQPNPSQDSYHFIQVTALSWDVFGAFAWLPVRDLSGKVVNVYPLIASPSRLTPKVAETDKGVQVVTGWQYRTPSGRQVEFTVDELIVVASPDPYGSLVARSVLDTAGSLLAARQSAERMNAQSFANNGVPPLVLEVPMDTTEDEREKLRKDWGEKYGGIKNSKRVGVMPSGVTVKELGATFNELEFLDGIKLQDRQICALLNVPVLEIFSGESQLGSGKESAEAAKKFWQNGLFPIMSRITSAWQNRIINPNEWDVQLEEQKTARRQSSRLNRSRKALALPSTTPVTQYIHGYFDVEQIDVFFEERLSRVETAAKAVGELRVRPNDAIRAFDLPFPSDNPEGDAILVNFNLVPFQQVVAIEPEPKPNSAPTNSGQPTTNEPVEMNDVNDANQRALESLKILGQMEGFGRVNTTAIADGVVKVQHRSQQKVFIETAFREIELETKRLAGHLKTFFFHQRKNTLGRLEKVGAANLESARAKSLKAEPFTVRIDWWLQPSGDDGLLLSVIQPAWRSAAESGGRTLTSTYGRPTVLATNDIVEKISKSRAKLVGEINRETERQLETVWKEWVASDKPADELFASVRQVFNRMTNKETDAEPRTVRIANVEVGSGFNFGVIEGGKKIGAKLKAWQNNPRPTMRPTHDDATKHYLQNPIPIDEPFEITSPSGVVEKMMFPRDPNASPDNTVNCQCVVVPIFDR
jgi:HK97 family phage portal protein